MTTEYSIQKMVSDGTLSTITLGIQYLQRNDIYMRIAGEETPQSGAPSGYTWSFVDNTTIKILPVVPNGVEVVVYRRTDANAMYNVYSQNAQFDEATIDENNTQLLFLSQEYLEQGAGIEAVEYLRSEGNTHYYRLQLYGGNYTDEFTITTQLPPGYVRGSGDFVTGFTVMPGMRNTVWLNPIGSGDGILYSWEGPVPSTGKVVPPNSTPETTGGFINAWAPRNDETLRSELATSSGAAMVGVAPAIPAAPMLNLQAWLTDEVVNLRTRFGLHHSASPRSNTDNLQAAYDALGAAGGGRLRLPAAPTPYYFAPSVLNETFENFGAIIQASWGCVVARPGVLLEGDGVGKSIFHIELGDLGTYGIIAASPNGGGFRDFTLSGNGSTGGNSHGIFNANISEDPAHQICLNWLISDMEIRDVGSYGLGVNNGDITNLRVYNVYIHNVGADGIDTKQRGPRKKNIGMNFSNVVVDGFGTRLTGCAGLDFHGVGQVTNLTVRNPGLTDQTGFRMRTLDPTNEGENARMSHASNIIVEAPPANNSNIGVFIGSPDCSVVGVVARGMTDGFQLVGNANGAPDRVVLSSAHAIDCSRYGYFVGTGVSDVTLETVHAIGCDTGFRNQGVRTTYIRAVPVGCATDFSTAGISAPTERMIGGGSFGMTELTSGTNIVTLEPRGESSDIEVRMRPKGISRLSLMDGLGNRKLQTDQNGISFNGNAPTGKMTLSAAATDSTTTTALVNQIRSGLLANGLAQ